jgi:hypothetical protein
MFWRSVWLSFRDLHTPEGDGGQLLVTPSNHYAASIIPSRLQRQ